MGVSKKTAAYWGTSFDKASQKYIDPVMRHAFTITHDGINTETWVEYSRETLNILLHFEMPSFPRVRIDTKNSKQKIIHSRVIESVKIAKELEKIEGKFNTFRKLEIGQWMKDSKNGLFDQMIDQGLYIISRKFEESVIRRNFFGEHF